MDRFSICLHGLGGQGLKSMIQDMLAPLILKTGLQVQAFPFFGGERRGAPVAGYLRCGEGKITTRSFISNPDMVVIFEHGRIPIIKTVENLRPGGLILINTAFPNQFMGLTHNWQVYTLNARAVSLAHEIGNPEDPYMIINSAMAGGISELLESIFNVKFADEMVIAVLNSALQQKVLENCEAFLDGKKNISRLAADSTPMWSWLVKSRAIPRLTQPSEYCTKCNLCYLFCPKRAIEINAKNASYSIDDEKCNYCGICVALCPRHAIKMVTKEGGRDNG